MNKKFLTMAGVVAVLSAGTFWGLEILDPHKVDEVKFPASVSVDQVFANKLNPNGAPDQTVAAANAAAVATPAGSDVTTAPAEASATPADAAATPTSSADETAAASSTTETTSSSEATTAAAPAAAAASEAAVSEPAQDNGSSPATSADETQTAAADTTTSAPTENSEAAAPAEAAPTESTPTEAAPAEAAPAEAAPAVKPAAVKKPAAHHAAKPAHHAAASTASTAKRSRWWPAENPANLSLVYAGPASFKKAIVLMFNGAFFKTDGLDQNLHVTDKNGQPVSGSWEIGENNRRMLVFPVPGDGQYKVSISTGLTDSKGRKIAHNLSGPVTIH